jgi:hypothetical protein
MAVPETAQMQPLSDAREGQPLRGFSENLELPDGDIPHDRGRVPRIQYLHIPDGISCFTLLCPMLLTALDQWSH